MPFRKVRPNNLRYILDSYITVLPYIPVSVVSIEDANVVRSINKPGEAEGFIDERILDEPAICRGMVSGGEKAGIACYGAISGSHIATLKWVGGSGTARSMKYVSETVRYLDGQRRYPPRLRVELYYEKKGEPGRIERRTAEIGYRPSAIRDMTPQEIGWLAARAAARLAPAVTLCYAMPAGALSTLYITDVPEPVRRMGCRAVGATRIASAATAIAYHLAVRAAKAAGYDRTGAIHAGVVARDRAGREALKQMNMLV